MCGLRRTSAIPRPVADHRLCTEQVEIMSTADWCATVFAVLVIVVTVTEEIKDPPGPHTAVPVYLESPWTNQLAG